MEQLTFTRFFLSLRTLFLLDYRHLFLLYLTNFFLCAVIFQAYYPYLFITTISILLMLTTQKKKDVRFLLLIYQFYLLTSILLIKIDISALVGYSDQFYAYMIPSSYYFESHFTFIDVLTNDIPYNSNYYTIEILWSKIIYVLKYLSIGENKIALIFNFSLYFVTAFYAYRSNPFNLPMETTKSFFIFMLFAPPTLFINSLYLRESLATSMVLLILISLIKKNYLIFIISTIVLLLTRNVYIIFAIFFIFILTIYFESNRRKKIIYLFLFLFVLSIGYLLLFEIGISEKFSGYLYYASGSVQIYSGSTLSRFLDQENLISIQNTLVILIGNLFSPSAFAFLKSLDFKEFIESIFVSIHWLIFLPFFILGIIKSHQNLKILLLAIFLAIYVSSSFTLLSPAPDTFRYRLPLYGIFMMTSFLGMYHYSILSETKEVSIYRHWFIKWYLCIGLVNIVYLVI